MTTYILRRLLLMFPTLLGITLVVFVVMAAAPGGISAQALVDGLNLEPQAKKALEDYYNRRYGLDQPAPVQYLRWLNNVSPVGFQIDETTGELGRFSFFKGSDLGMSFRYGRPVMDLIAERLPITLLLNVVSIPIIYVIAIAVGVHAATRRGSSFDVSSSVVMLGLWSVPTMLAGVLLIGFFASDQFWRWFPTAGISRREALDMPFLPHWGSLGEVLLLFLAVGLCAALLVWLSLRGTARLRMALLGALGAGAGVVMAGQVSEGFSATQVVLALLVGAAFAGIGWSGFQALRTVTMGLIGVILGILLVAQFFPGEFVRGFLLDRLWHLVLPVICLSYGGFAFLAKLTRSSVLENLLADYARTARAKGVSESDVLWKHVFRNSLLPLITVSATLLPSLLAGSVIVETIFSIDGMGKLAVEAVRGRDRELVLSVTLISGLLTLAGYLLADLCYAIVDPRVSYD
ncbi:ABC transporter permease [Thioalkalivibrio sulfidiphilus]|uniref:Binding-protein-dependent transport systems inner membrane component n=1 Tax=Thioalkalivibrio sulfidiphilus (strain HL-EbGR7) TaxID=396588 RepID=B8GNU7_THISH|nr:ABC transporter permease [Thioalkalivibrio sulfidiphilus]ACL72036.1 binding-protein-dependent transport systems inner membrane component [Thioalkalivibrio sulfidiphilus HL-EbGr7]